MIGALFFVKAFILFVLNLLLSEALLPAFNSPSCQFSFLSYLKKLFLVLQRLKGFMW